MQNVRMGQNHLDASVYKEENLNLEGAKVTCLKSVKVLGPEPEVSWFPGPILLFPF